MIWESKNKRGGPTPQEIKNRIKSQPIFISREALEDIRNWMPDHIGEDDRRQIYDEHYEIPDFDLGI